MTEKLPTPRTVYATALPVNSANAEMLEISLAGGKALKQPGRELMPVKRDMLGSMTDAQANAALDACAMLFAAVLEYEGALMAQKAASDAVTLVSARMGAGRAEAVVRALFYGPTRFVLLAACETAPIAFYAMAKASPDLNIIDRCRMVKASATA